MNQLKWHFSVIKESKKMHLISLPFRTLTYGRNGNLLMVRYSHNARDDIAIKIFSEVLFQFVSFYISRDYFMI